ncbi:MAG: zinc-ribbon domain-containing protein [Lachnospiraceae bacterium]|nr:zinc-ribbon domain-containing protein [Lachnospiraceae bacterium]
MGYCTKCGAKLSDGDAFCTACGAATDEKESKAKEALSSKTEKTPYADLIKKPNNSKEKKETSEKKREKKKEKEEQVEEGAMKAFKRSCFPAYLFAALFFLYAGEELFCSSAMIRSGRFLTDSEVISAGRKGIIVFAILAVLSGICVSYERKRIDKAAGRTLKAIMQLLFAAGFTYTCVGYFMKDGNVSGNMAWVIASAAAAFISLLTVVLCLYSAVADNSVWDEPKGFLKNFFYAVRSPLSLLLWMIFCLIVFALPMICTLLVSNLSRITEITFALKMGMYITAEAVEAGLICLLYMSLEKKIKKRKAGLDSKKSRDEEKEERKKGVRFSDIFSLCMGAFGLVCLIPICFPKTGKAADRIFNDIDNILAESSIKVYEADLSGAFVYADEAWYMTEAYKAYLKGDSYALEQMTRTRPDSEVVWALYTDLTGNINALEEHMMYDEVQNKNIGNVLLNAYCTGDAARLSDDEKEYKKALLKDRMNLGIFTYDIPIPEKKQEASNSGKDGNDPDALNTLEKKYVSVSGYMEALRQLVNLSAFGVENNDVVRKVIDLAEKYPDDASLLFLAGAVGAEAASDNAWHYSTCIEKLKKFAELVQQDSTLKDDDKSNRLFSAAKLMSVMRGYEDALTVLKTIDELKISDRNNDTKMLKLLCYDRLNDGENCYMTAKDLYAGGNTGFQVLYYYAVGAIKKGDRVESIKALEAYADKLLKTETSDNDFIPAQAQFHVLVSYATVSKNNSWVKYGFEFYHDLSDEEKNALSPFLHNYMEMLSEYYWYGDVEKSASAAAEVLKKRNDLVYAYYMQGIQNYDTGKYEDSRDAYLKANELYPDNPTILYGLAYAYDALKEYEAAFEASERCKLLVPAVDHEEDWYGLGYHNLNLYYALKQHLESEVSE